MQGEFKPLFRHLQAALGKAVGKGHSFFLFGPRQVGKTTVISNLLAGRDDIVHIPLQDPALRKAYEKRPGSLVRQIRQAKGKKLVFIDEVQKVPELLDAVQLLVDEGTASFILTGSSARKLRRAGTNLLPGRVLSFHLDPMGWSEMGWPKEHRIPELEIPSTGNPVEYSLDQAMVFGSLPGIVTLVDESDRKDFLQAYTKIYLEEEIRAEALSRKIGAFSIFLELAAAGSGTSPNLSKLSMEAGVSVPAIKEYFQILEDTLVAERVDPYLKNSRKRILSTPRYYFFDIGVRNALAEVPLEISLVNAQKGILFEHAVILEIIRRVRMKRQRYRVCFWRTSGGAEVDCVIDMGSKVIPIEIKASESVRMGELKGLSNFLQDYRKVADHGYVITQGRNPESLSDNITALPWQYL